MGGMYVDIHCHLDDRAFAGMVAEVIERAKAAGVKVIISNGTNWPSNEAVRDLAAKYPVVRPAYGLYPTEPLDETGDDAALVWIREQALSGAHPPVAIGEVGLDGVEPVTDEQRIRFRKCVALATELRVPLIIHSRKAEQDVFDELAQARVSVPVVMHCFGGAKKLVVEGAKRGYHFSIPATVGRATQFQMIVDLVPTSQLLTETDSPYLSADKETFPNEPAAVVGTVEKIAEIKKITVEECKQILFMNYQRVFS